MMVSSVVCSSGREMILGWTNCGETGGGGGSLISMTTSMGMVCAT